MANIEQMFRISLEQEMCDVFYYQQVAHDKKDLIHKVPWGATIIRNCLPGGSSMKGSVLGHWVPGAGAKILSKQISFLSKQSLD